MRKKCKIANETVISTMMMMRRVMMMRRSVVGLRRGCSSMSEGEFHSVANDTLERLSMAFEELESEVGEEFDLVESVRRRNVLARYIY